MPRVLWPRGFLVVQLSNVPSGSISTSALSIPLFHVTDSSSYRGQISRSWSYCDPEPRMAANRAGGRRAKLDGRRTSLPKHNDQHRAFPFRADGKLGAKQPFAAWNAIVYALDI